MKMFENSGGKAIFSLHAIIQTGSSVTVSRFRGIEFHCRNYEIIV